MIVYYLCVCQEPPTEGTVKPYPSFNAETDARTLRTAMKGLGMLVTIDNSMWLSALCTHVHIHTLTLPSKNGPMCNG